MLPRQLLPFVLIVFVLKVLKGVSGYDEACLPGSRAAAGDAPCLSLIRQKAVDTSAFPFSAPFSTLCPPEVRESSVACFGTPERLPLDQPYSLSMLVFGAECMEDPLSQVDRYLDVLYTSPPGNYTGCDHTFSTEDEIQFRLDPLEDTSVAVWFTRLMPTLTWPAARHELYSLFIVDIEGKLLHGAFVNIRGNDVRNSMVLREYMMSMNMRPSPRVFTFLLYKQTRHLVHEALPTQDFNLTHLVKAFNLQGPVGIHWMLMEADAFSIHHAQSAYGVHNCGQLLQKDMTADSPDLPFLTRPYHLSVHLRVKFTYDRLTHDCIILTITHPANEFFLDPLRNPLYNNAILNEYSQQTYYMTMNRVNPNNDRDFAGKLYTLMLVDADVPTLYNLIINIPGDDVSSGTTVVPYRQPGPPSVHDHYFLLFEQTEEISLAATAAFTRPHPCPDNRCLHGIIQAFLCVHDLQLVGANRFRTSNDDYVQCHKQAVYKELAE